MVAFDCRITQQMEVGSHFVFLGLIEAVNLASEPGAPLLYGMGSYGIFQPAGAS